MKDYYSILGLDSDASPDTIKATFRRLAREAHPDRMRHLGAAEQAEASARMTDLNEAYSTLSNPARRREYDQEVRAAAAAQESGEPAARPPAPSPAAAEAPPVTPLRGRSRADAGVGSSVVQQYSGHMLQELLSKKGEFPWQSLKLEGFDWALESGFWLAHYVVGFRGFGTADPEAARKFSNYSQFAMERCRSMLKQNFYLFLLAFQRINSLDQTMTQLRRFAGSPGQKAIVMLVDVNHQRVVPCGPRIQDDRLEKLMGRVSQARQ